jgi:hypothetical protein
MDSLVQMALLSQSQGKNDERDRYVQDVMELWDQGYHFDYHLGTLERGLGNYCLTQSKYEEAFGHFAEALAHLGRFTSIQYRQAFRDISENLLALPADVVQRCMKIMKERWERESELIALHPEVMELVS